MMNIWRFDQGRLDYFQFDEVKKISKGLTKIDGILKPNIQDDLLRKSLSQYSQRPFAPSSYTVWRNYKRVFGCLLLASEINGRIYCTNLCKALSSEEIDVDDYMGYVINHFYYPSPVFDGYSHTTPQTFPIIAILKLLLSEYLTKGKPYLTIDDIGKYLIANHVNGAEPLEFFSRLQPAELQRDLRQTRELVRFASQLSFLKWSDSSLFLEIQNSEDAYDIEQLLMPQIKPRDPNPALEIMCQVPADYVSP